MTLCIAWKDSEGVHFASDSRLTLATDSVADVGVKVLALPLRILDPGDDTGGGAQTVAFRSELGMCFAGSAVNSLTIKESLAEVLQTLQHVPDHTDTSMQGIAAFIFTAYKSISQRVCETAIGANGRADILVGGLCAIKKTVRVFRFCTDAKNKHSYTEVLTVPGYVLLGSGSVPAENQMPQNPSKLDYLNVLRCVIGDPEIGAVGGNIQYGLFIDQEFRVHGIYENGPPVHHWRAGLDFNSAEFIENESGFIPGTPLINPFGPSGA